METLSKDNSSVTSERTKPTLVDIGGRKVISTGRWNDQLMAEYVLVHSRDKWLKIGELARVSCGSNTIPNKKRVRKHLSSLFLFLMDRELFLAVDYGDNGAANAVKIADLQSQDERDCVNEKMRRMQRSKEISVEKFEKATALLAKKN
jgi:hypothetical protein